MSEQPIEPFLQFQNKMSSNLNGWLKNQQNIYQLLQDQFSFIQHSKSTLNLLESNYENKKILSNLGENCFIKSKRINDKIVIRCKEDIYVQFTKLEAIPFVKQLIKLYQEKLSICKEQICKIMVSVRQMESLMIDYQKIL